MIRISKLELEELFIEESVSNLIDLFTPKVLLDLLVIANTCSDNHVFSNPLQRNRRIDLEQLEYRVKKHLGLIDEK